MTVNRYTLLSTVVAALLVCSGMLVHAQEAGAANVDETQHTEAAVMAVEQHWSIAEMTGDSAWLADMLMPDYRTVNNDGTVHDKQTLLARMAKRKSITLSEAQLKIADYRKEHHSGSSVAIHGDTAIVCFYDTTLGPQKGMSSADMFVYEGGHWHALYSQHTGLHG